MNQDRDAFQGELAIQTTGDAASARTRPWSDRTVLAALLIGCNLLVFAFIQSSHLQFDKGDFKMFYTAAIVLRSGHDIYNPETYDPMQGPLVSTPSDIKPYTHPPYELLAILPFSFLPYKIACWCWLAFTLSLALACGRLLGNYAAVLGMFPFLFVLWEQQDSILTLLIVITCWFALKNQRDVVAGLILGLALFKFQIAIPLALVLGFWRPRLLKGFTISGVAVFALSVEMVRPAGMIAYWHYLVGMTRAASTTINIYHMDPTHNVALRGLVYEMLGPHISLVTSVTVILGLFIIGVAWWFMRDSELSWEVKFSFAVIAALLLSFHLLTHDLILLSLPFVLLIGSLARWPLVVLYFFPMFPLIAAPSPAWLALLPVSSLAAMTVLYWIRPWALFRNFPMRSRLGIGVTRDGRDSLSAVNGKL